MRQSPSSTKYTSNPEDTVLIQGNQDLINGKIFPRVYTTQITKKALPSDIILTVRAPVGDIAINEYVACIGRGVCSLSNMDNSEFIYYYLQYLTNKNIWKKYAQGSTFESINSKDIKLLNINIPSFNEQNKISKLLKVIDVKTTLMERNMNLYQNILTNMRYEIFTNMNNITVYALSDISTINKGKQLNKENMNGGNYYVLNGGKLPSGKTDTWNVEENTITISEGGESCGYVNYNNEKFYCGGHCFYLTLKNNIDKYYLFNYLKFKESEIMRLRVGSGLPNIQKKDLLKFKIELCDDNN